MSPYQQDVINATLGEYDLQAQKGLGTFADNAYTAGAFGGAREGVKKQSIMAGSDRNRAALQAQLLGQGFTQANELAQNQFGQQMNLAKVMFLALQGQQVAGLTTMGGATSTKTS